MTGKSLHPATLAAQALGWTEASTGGIVLPVHTSTTFLRDPDNQYRRGRSYGRADNPSYDQPQALLTALEGGAASLVFSSGMAAAAAVFQSLGREAHVVAPRVMYWGLRSWLRNFAEDWGIEVEFVDATSLDALSQAVRPGRTRLIWIETPANPLWSVTDISGAAEIAHAAGAMLAVDSTAATPVLTRPLALGADLVMHSATKYLNGHSDVMAGTLTTAREDAFWARLCSARSSGGAILGGFEAYLLLRGMRTLFLRVERTCRSAQQIAETLSESSESGRGAVSGAARSSRPRGRGAADDRRFWRDVEHPCARRRRSGHIRGGSGRGLETRHLARRGREPDRAPRLDRRRRQPGSSRSAAPLGWNRRPRRPPG